MSNFLTVDTSGAQDETDAVQQALQIGLEALGEKETLAERVAVVQLKAKLAGLKGQGRDSKAFMDGMWGDT